MHKRWSFYHLDKFKTTKLNFSHCNDWVKILALIAAVGVEIYSGLGSNAGVTLIGDVTYRRHG